MSVTLKHLNINIAEQFKESVSEPSPNTKLYFAYGRVYGWANDANPQTANSSLATEYEVWKNMIGAKKITGSDIRHVIPRHNWVANTKYISYDSSNPDMLQNNNCQFYVITSQNHIFKCIANNNGANSTVEPSTLNFNTTTTTVQDGYVWKYMYSLSDQEILRFSTNEYIPVKTLSDNDGSTQWQVQDGAIDGGILNIDVANGGFGYTNTSNIQITITGDGSSATATASINVSSQTVSNVTITNPGQGYTYGYANISGGGGANASLRVITSPSGGHGSDPLYELGGSNLLINARLISSEGNTVPISHSYRQISLLVDPKKYNSEVISSNGVINQTYQITTIGSGTYTVGEWIYQGPTFDSSTFRGTVVEDNSGVIRVSNYEGTPTVGTLTGITSGTVRYTTSDVNEPELTKYSGKVVYVDNLRPVTRDADQTEEYRIIIRF